MVYLIGRVLSVHSSECRVALGEDTVSCTFRGRLRLDSSRVYAGDIVSISHSGESMLSTESGDRRNLLVRPPCSQCRSSHCCNCHYPASLDLLYIDRILVQLESQGIQGVICINKQDLEDQDEIDKVSGYLFFCRLPVCCYICSNRPWAERACWPS